MEETKKKCLWCKKLLRLVLFTLCGVEPGSELAFNYQLECVGETKKKCLCDAKKLLRLVLLALHDV